MKLGLYTSLMWFNTHQLKVPQMGWALWSPFLSFHCNSLLSYSARIWFSASVHFMELRQRCLVVSWYVFSVVFTSVVSWQISQFLGGGTESDYANCIALRSMVCRLCMSSITLVDPAKTVGHNDVPFGRGTRVVPGNILLSGLHKCKTTTIQLQ